MTETTARGLLGVALAVVALGAGGCGDDEGGETASPPSAGEWRESVEGFCSDGYQEATALPLPEKLEQLGPDASARAEILGNVRDSIVALGQPDGISSDDVGGYVDELNADIQQLGQIAAAAEASDPDAGMVQLDESAGQAAAALGLDDCAALSQAIARTP